MVETYTKRVHTEPVVLDIGQDIGALILYAPEHVCGMEIEISLRGYDVLKTHTAIWERKFNGRTFFAGVFPALPAGEYNIWWSAPQPIKSITIVGGQVAEVDCRDLIDTSLPMKKYSHRHQPGTRTDTSLSCALPDFLPPRYQDGRIVSAAPMGTAPMCYTDDGQVAWNEMWTDFCDLALAGGPSHRDTLLEPAPPEEVRANLDAYERVVAEIERGFRLVTGLATVRSEKLGWVGLQCDDEEMALWLLRAIVVENVCVRREKNVLFLPAGPMFQMEKEIKNVITVVAKTHHYWTEHILG